MREEKRKAVLIDLSDFIQKRIDYFYYLIKSKRVMIIFKKIQGCVVEMREVDLQRIVDNTLSNAIKYAQAGSGIKIELINNDDSVIFKSQNSGSVVKNIHKIFNQGYRENFEQVGMGIGLEIVSSICNMYNIKPEVISKDGVTSFKYEIPKIKFQE